ncbi:hypothetical protein ACFU9W_44845 [Streptomyces sp. NPDC057600]|uniref:hypothetical protein n=1 Tax=Streptomyces sp. NPDC057600 TaxID=3346180 RepID=UPI0036B49903
MRPLIVRTPQLGVLLVAAGLVGLLPRGGVPVLAGLFVLAIAFLGVLAVRLAWELPALAAASSSRRTVRDARWETNHPSP